jgi:hypothetical protein
VLAGHKSGRDWEYKPGGGAADVVVEEVVVDGVVEGVVEGVFKTVHPGRMPITLMW